MPKSIPPIPVEVLAALVKAHPFYEIARMYKCDARTIGKMATAMGLKSGFVGKPATRSEIARIHALGATGMSVSKISQVIGRSQDLVARCLARAKRASGAYGNANDSLPWPKVNTTADKAFGSKMFENYTIPAGPTIDATRVRRSHDVVMGCAAAMCADA